MSSRGACRALVPLMMASAMMGLSGCSLLFVAKGSTRMDKGKQASVPVAEDLTRQIDAPVIVMFKTRPRETFSSVSELFFGDDSQARSIAQWNHLSPKKKLKPGTRLKILNPDESPDLIHLPALAKTKSQVSNGTRPPEEKTNGLFSPQPTIPVPDLSIARVPRPRINQAFGPGEKMKFEVRALSMLGGYATLEVENYTTVAGRPCMVLTARANSVSRSAPSFPSRTSKAVISTR